MENKNLPIIIRTAFAEQVFRGKVSEKTGTRIYELFSSIVHSLVVKGVVKLKMDDQRIDDLIMDSIEALLAKFKREIDGLDKLDESSISFKYHLIVSDESNKIITSYIFEMIKNGRTNLLEKNRRNESVNLHKALIKTCKSLVESDFLEETNNYYSKKGIKDLTNFTGEPINFGFNITEWQKDGYVIKSKLLEELIVILFNEYLEKTSISFSNLLEQISLITVIGKPSVLSLDDNDSEYFDSQMQAEENLNINESQEAIILIWLQRLKTNLKEEKQILYSKVFLLRFIENLGLEEIGNLIGVATQTVKNYQDRFVEIVDFEKELNSSDAEFNNYIYSFAQKLNNEFKLNMSIR